MNRRKERRKKLIVATVGNGGSINSRMAQYLEWMRERNYSAETVRKQEVRLARFMQWCEEREYQEPAEITKRILERYQTYLYHYRTEKERPLSFTTQQGMISPVRGFFTWMTKQNYLGANPAADLELPRKIQRLPKAVMNIAEVEEVLNQAASHSEIGIRDRAIMETLYSTGMRRGELVKIKLVDLDVERGTIIIRQGKGKKDRMIPIGERAVMWIEKYIWEVRPNFRRISREADDGTIFLTRQGESLTSDLLSKIVTGYVKAANIGKEGSCHMFRHTCATLMLEGGADIRYIQQLLGHVELSTTEIYTRVSIRALKAVHTATHPAKSKRTLSLNSSEE